MDEKQPLLQAPSDASPFRNPVSGSRTRCYVLALVLGFAALLYWLNGLMGLRFPCDADHYVPSLGHQAAAKRVPLEAHIMSKCPDARDCLNDLVVPAMANISSKVDFKLSYIGEIDEEDGGVECKHGPSECMGNIIQLCAAELYPDPKIYLGFATCLTNDYESIPEEEFVRGCALEHDVDFEKLNECASRDNGAHGEDLLRDSVNATANAGVRYSCTVRLDNDVRCIRDGGEWKNCPGGSKPQDLVKSIIQATK